MRAAGAPFRSLALILVLWICGRGWMLWSGYEAPRLAIASATLVRAPEEYATLATQPVPRDAPPTRTAGTAGTAPLPHPQNGVQGTPTEQVPPAKIAGAAVPLPAQPTRPHAEAGDWPAVLPSSGPNGNGTNASRWSGSGWIFLRGGDSKAALATAGGLGGAQAGARIRWRINNAAPTRAALSARITRPLNGTRGLEAAVGAEWRPVAAQTAWLAVERRFALDAHARNAWSAYMAGGFWKPNLPFGFIADGYSQAGVVGARRRDLFADGALRVSRPLSRPEGIRVGAGVWGAAQPGTARLDIGPHVSAPLRLSKQPLRLSADFRFRVAGQARPRSGLAVTLGTDF